MRDIVITGAKIRRELRWLLAAFIIANLMNVFAIAIYKTEWKELFTMMRYVLILSLVLYLVMLLVRWIVGGVRRLAGRRQTA